MADSEVPLSPQAQDAKESMQRQLLRTMASKMYAAALEEERERRVKEQQAGGEALEEDAVRRKAFENLMRVQEDMVRAANVMKAKAEFKMEQVHRVTEMNKEKVHAELVRRSSAKEVDKQAEEERERRLGEQNSQESCERQKTYNKLVTVQEDLLKTFRKMQVDGEIKAEQERRVNEGKKLVMQEQLVKSFGQKTAASEMDREKKRRTESLSDETECQRIETIAFKLIDVQKELLATQKPVQAIGGTISQQVLEESKAFVQEQIRRKAAQKEAILLMDKEQKRRIADSPNHAMSDPHADLLETITRRASIKDAKAMAEATQKEFMQAEVKTRAQEEMVRKVNQKCVDKAMDDERSSRIEETTGKEPPQISKNVKQQIEERTAKN